MQILSEQRLNEIMSVFKFFGSIANDHRLPLPNEHTGEDSYSSNLYSTFSHTPYACVHFIGSFRFFSEKFSALLILLLHGTAKNEGIPEINANHKQWRHIPMGDTARELNVYLLSIIEYLSRTPRWRISINHVAETKARKIHTNVYGLRRGGILILTT